jgi:CRISPR-associated exonuclease Cas4
MGESMLEVIEDAFNRALVREPVNDSGTVYVTELTGCIRRSWYRRRYGYRATRDMIVGIAVHSDVLLRVALLMEGEYDVVAVEKKVERLINIDGNDVWLTGRVDLYIADKEKNIRTFVEFKTSEWIFEEHVEQGNIYAVMLDIDKFYICFMPKSDAVKCREFQKTWTENDIIERVKQLLGNSEPPRREGVWCSYCEFKNMCKKNKTLV